MDDVAGSIPRDALWNRDRDPQVAKLGCCQHMIERCASFVQSSLRMLPRLMRLVEPLYGPAESSTLPDPLYQKLDILRPTLLIATAAQRKLWVLEPKALPTFLSNEQIGLNAEDRKLASYHLSRMIRAAEARKD